MLKKRQINRGRTLRLTELKGSAADILMPDTTGQVVESMLQWSRAVLEEQEGPTQY